jgi:hypothetical protein
MKIVKTGKPLSQIAGFVEYTLYFKDFGYHYHEVKDKGFIKIFTNLEQLIELFSREYIEKWRETFGADEVRITNIYIEGMGEGGNKTTVRIGDKMDGWVSTNVAVDDADSKMLRCVNEIEEKLKEVLNRINIYKNL